MIWAILAILGVPLWLIVGGVAFMLLTNRRLKHRQGNLPVRLRPAAGKRWRRGNAIWVGDVFACRNSPSGLGESLDLVRSATQRDLTPEEAHQLRRLGGPTIAVLTTKDRIIEVAAASAEKDALLGPFNGRPAGA